MVARTVLISRQAMEGMVSHATRTQPLAGTIISVVLTLVSVTMLSFFLTKRTQAIKNWRRLPFVVGIILFIYIDSFMFVFASSIVQYGLGVNRNLGVCDTAILICLVFYVTTKIAIYLFLVEKAYIIRGGLKRRMQSKLYLFNSFGMMGVYAVVVVLNFVYRINRLEDGQCYIGMQKLAMIPLISFDALVNIYLTILFLIPLMDLYSFKNLPRTPANARLRTVAIRTFIGACSTLISSIVNLTVLMLLNGEPGWVCLMCCNSDILFSAIVLYWIASRDNAASDPAADREKPGNVGPLTHHGPDRGGVYMTGLNGTKHEAMPSPVVRPHSLAAHPRRGPPSSGQETMKDGSDDDDDGLAADMGLGQLGRLRGTGITENLRRQPVSGTAAGQHDVWRRRERPDG